ncbi:MAG: DUF192 domain-containing protein [Candidatus Omnitrophota bacterium]|nr:DUF192 domain-containing protein [Candidatus Omnitrophota bacterium]MBU1929328.1 DUF192 domain-containing protein [Candidatus Omnitrophota bacterium]MBU2035620.1 DUF192 domain-containing protein [Candidatus Omnitrophota bacterium]MBU2258709.1 DUF192 domain-containing protein [Candidatus Omnitrophota bacterium]
MSPILLLIFFLSPLYAQIRQACIRNVCIQIEIVDSPQDRSRGLMFREKLGEKEGMLFIFKDRGRHNIWMKNMKFPLDIIWINQDKIIVDIRKNVPPCSQYECPSYTPQVNAKYVLEVNAGFTDKHKIGVGEAVKF